MKLFSRKGILTVPPLSSVATIGFFDGVHLGHRFLLDTVLSASASRGLHSMAVTFPQSPFSVLHPESDVRLLSTSEEKVERLLDAGIDVVAMLPFTKELASLSSESFMSDILLRELHVKALVTGYDHHFGHGGNSSFEDYQRYGSAIGMEVIQASRLNQDGLPMSSPVFVGASGERLSCGHSAGLSHRQHCGVFRKIDSRPWCLCRPHKFRPLLWSARHVEHRSPSDRP